MSHAQRTGNELDFSFYVCMTLFSTEDAIKKRIAPGKLEVGGFRLTCVEQAASDVGELTGMVLANTIARPEIVASAVAQEIAGSIPEKLKKKGIVAEAAVRLVQGSFILLQVTLLHGPSLSQIVKKLGSANEGAGKVGVCCLSCMSKSVKDKLERDVIGKLVARKVVEGMAADIEQKTSKKGLAVAADAVTAEELGPYLVEALCYGEDEPRFSRHSK